MESNQKPKTLVVPLEAAKYFRDEMNFAEFPLASLGSKGGKESLVFEDEVFDKSNNRVVTRKLTVSPSTEHGLPTALDEEVLLGLIQLTFKKTEVDRTQKVYFTRYELIEELGWSHQTKNYARIETALKKWLGVTLYYDNAWWNNEEKSWVTEAFHVIDSFTLLDSERLKARKKARGKTDPNAGKSCFSWNEHVYRSFEAGYLKKLNFNLVKSLESHAAKRMYRFLDKRFYKKSSWTFDLAKFACEHIGLPRTFSNSKLKERLLPAIKELEEKGFLEKLSEDDRFRQVRRGEWKIYFRKAGEGTASVKPKEAVKVNFPQAIVDAEVTAPTLSSELEYFYSLSKDEQSAILAVALEEASAGEKAMLRLTGADTPFGKAAKDNIVSQYLSKTRKVVGA